MSGGPGAAGQGGRDESEWALLRERQTPGDWASNTCLTVAGNATTQGTPIVHSTYAGSVNQKWYFERITGSGGQSGSRIVSVDFVVGASGGDSGTVTMDPTESAGVKAASHWNSAAGAAGALSTLILADGGTPRATRGW